MAKHAMPLINQKFRWCELSIVAIDRSTTIQSEYPPRTGGGGVGGSSRAQRTRQMECTSTKLGVSTGAHIGTLSNRVKAIGLHKGEIEGGVNALMNSLC